MVVGIKPINAPIIFNPEADTVFNVGDKLIIAAYFIIDIVNAPLAGHTTPNLICLNRKKI